MYLLRHQNKKFIFVFLPFIVMELDPLVLSRTISFFLANLNEKRKISGEHA